MSKYAGAHWIAEATKKPLSALGIAAADLLGDVFLGIYHLPTKALLKVDWEEKNCIEINLPTTLSTVDDNLLTRLVLLAHDRMLRVSVEGCGPRLMKYYISQRTTRHGSLFERCPTIEEHITQLRNQYR